jgi:hypothetical protein
LDWSYELLDPAEQVLLARLSVFAGGFELDAAERVCGVDPVDSGEVMDLLVALVDKSLVVAGEHDGRSRYWLLETVRAYAAERLADRGETEILTARHAAWVVWLAQSFWLAVARQGGTRTVEDQPLVREADNARVAHTWTVEQANAVDAQWIASAFAAAWHDRGAAAEVTERCEEALAIPTAEPDALVACLCHGGAVRGLHWRWLPSWSHCAALLELAEGLDDLVGLYVWVTLATVAAEFDAPSELTLDTCIARAREFDPADRQRGYLLMIEGQHRLRTGRAEEAQSLLADALRSLGEASLQGWCLLMLATTRYVLSGDIDLTDDDVDRICTGDAVKQPFVLRLQAIQAAIDRRPVHDVLVDAVDITRRLGLSDDSLFTAVAAAAMETGDAATSAQLLGAAAAASDWASLAIAERVRPRLREQLGVDEFDRCFAEGRRLHQDDAVALALEL